MSLAKMLEIAWKHGRTHLTYPLAHAILQNYMSHNFLVSYPRSGSTWLRTMLCNVLDPSAQGDPRVFNQRIPGVTIRRLPLVTKAAKTNPVIYHSHTRYISGFKKVVYVVRDGRDSIVSLYHYTTTRNGNYMDFSEWFKMYKQGFFGVKWHAHVESWLTRGAKELGDNFLLIRFEDMKRDTVTSLSTILKFMGIETSSDRLKDAIENASIEKARHWERLLTGEPPNQNASFYRGP